MFQELCLVGLSIGGGMISPKVGRQGKPGRSSEVFSAPTALAKKLELVCVPWKFEIEVPRDFKIFHL